MAPRARVVIGLLAGALIAADVLVAVEGGGGGETRRDATANVGGERTAPAP